MRGSSSPSCRSPHRKQLVDHSMQWLLHLAPSESSLVSALVKYCIGQFYWLIQALLDKKLSTLIQNVTHLCSKSSCLFCPKWVSNEERGVWRTGNYEWEDWLRRKARNSTESSRKAKNSQWLGIYCLWNKSVFWIDLGKTTTDLDRNILNRESLRLRNVAWKHLV